MLQALIILTFALTGCGLFGKSDNVNKTKAQLHLELGTTHFLRGNYPLALQELSNAARFDPENPVIQNNLGLAYMVREKFDDAEVCFQKALGLKPGYTDARNNLGRLYIDVGLYPKAIKELETAVADLTYSEPEKSWANLGEAYFKSNQYARAKEAFKRSLKDRRESCYGMNYYGRTLFELKEYPSASEALDRAVTLCASTKLDEPYFYSGLSFYKMGKFEQARARLTELLQFKADTKYAAKTREMLEIMK